jgi:DNA-binding response OmpR family regulator
MLLDWHLPGLDGHAVLSAMRAEGIPLRVLMLTGYGDTHREAAMAAGANAFVEKPCGLEELVAAVAAVAADKSVEKTSATAA